MKNFIKTGGLMLLALLFAGLAGWGTLSYLNSREAELRQAAASMDGPSVEIVVASTSVGPGDVISLDNMAIADVPQKYLAQDVIAPGEFAEYAEKTILVALDAGRPLLRSYISGLSHHASFSAHLQQGWRAMTLAIDELNAVAGMLEAGDFIDLVISGKDDPGAMSGTSPDYSLRRLMERVEVLATGTMTRLDAQFAKASGVYPSDAFYGTITISVPAHLVTDILNARDDGNLNILLRHPNDTGIASYPGSSKGLSARQRGIEMIGGGSDGGVLNSRYELLSGALLPASTERYRLPQRFSGQINISSNKSVVGAE